MAAPDFSIPHAVNDVGATTDANEVQRRLNGGFWLTDPSGAASVDVANFVDAVARINASGHRGRIFIPPGTYICDQPIVIDGLFGSVIKGMGYVSQFSGHLNDNTLPVIKLNYCSHCRFEDFYLTTSQPRYALLQVLGDGGAHTQISTANLFTNLYLDAGNGKALNAVVLGGTGSVDANNEAHVFDHCSFVNYSLNGVMMNATQIYNIVFRGCNASSDFGAEHGLQALTGNFSWYDGNMHGHTVSDIDFLGWARANLIQGLVSEGSSRFITNGGGQGQGLMIDGCRAAANGLHADGKMIKLGAGLQYITLRNNDFGDSNAGADVLFEFLSAAENANNIISIANRYISPAAQMFSATVPRVMMGDTQVLVENGLSAPLDGAHRLTATASVYLYHNPTIILQHNTVAIIATMLHALVIGEDLTILNQSASGTAAHQVKLPSGYSFDAGGHNTVTLDAPNEYLVCKIISATRLVVIADGASGFSTT